MNFFYIMNFAKTKLKSLGGFVSCRPMFKILHNFKEVCA